MPRRREQLRLPTMAAEAAAATADPLADFFWSEVERARALAEEPSPSPEEPRREYLAVRLATESYAFPIERIREIQKPLPITEVPRAPREVVGILSLRGEVVPVIDPRVRLDLPRPEPTRTARVVIVDPGDGPCALVVDQVLGVVHLGSSDVEPVPRGLASEPDLLTGVARSGEQMLVLLDLATLLAPGAVR
jgi:purine-binding chemotaxis protein CheW